MAADPQSQVAAPPQPPPGFQLDAPQQGGQAPPTPPPGFNLDKASGAETISAGHTPFDWNKANPSQIAQHVMEPITSYTQEGRAKHPILSRVGDAMRRLWDYGRLLKSVGKTGVAGMVTPAAEGEAVAPAAGAVDQEFENFLGARMMGTEPPPSKPNTAPKEPIITPQPAQARQLVRAPQPQLPTHVDKEPIITAAPQARPLSAERQLPPHREPIITAAPQARPLSAERQLPPHREPLITPPPADRSGPIPPEERIDLGRGGYPEPTPAAPPQAKPLTGSTAQQVDQLVNKAYGVQPLEKNVPLRSQIETKGYGAQYGAPGRAQEALGATQATAKPLTPTAQPNAPETPPMAQPMSLAEKYPDKAIRQMVHANGEKIVNAVGEDKETMVALHNLTAVDLRQALINAGEDMGQSTITSSRFAGPGAITRQQAFDRLLEKGHSPQDIVRLAKVSPKTR